MDSIREFFCFLARRPSVDLIKEERMKKRQTLKLIKKYRIPFTITDRQSGEKLYSLSKYDEKKHDLVVDAFKFMRVLNTTKQAQQICA